MIVAAPQHRRWHRSGPALAFLVVVLTGLGACGGGRQQPVAQTPDVHETVASGAMDLSALQYTGPTDRQIALRPLVLDVPPGEAEDWLAGAIRVAGFRPVQSRPGVFVALYRGRADRLVDCGSIQLPGAETRTEAAGSWSMPAGGPPGAVIDREVELHARLVAGVAPMGASATRIDPTIHYVLVKRLVATDRNGNVVADEHDVIDFDARGAGRFETGAQCRSSGALETALFGVPPRRGASRPVVDDAALAGSGAT